MEIVNLRTEAERTAASRSRVYHLLAMAFSFPDADFFASLRDGTLATALRDACVALPYDVKGAIEPLSTVDGTAQDFESEYIRLVLGTAGGNLTRAAAILGIDRKTLRQKLRSPAGT